MPEDLAPAWPCLRLVADRLATWTEVTTVMSIDDVIDLSTAADIMFDATNTPPPRGA